jgi:hypothetical protein
MEPDQTAALEQYRRAAPGSDEARAQAARELRRLRPDGELG